MIYSVTRLQSEILYLQATDLNPEDFSIAIIHDKARTSRATPKIARYVYLR